MVGLMALLPQVADAVAVPVIATGGIADARGVAAALILGASAVQVGTGFLRAPEAMTSPVYAERLGQTEADETLVTRAFTGRAGRSIATAYVRAALTGPPRSAISSAARAHLRNAGSSEEGWRRRPHATVGWAERQTGAG